MTDTLEPLRLSNSGLVVECSTEYGPRITHFGRIDGDNVLAVLGDLSIDLPDQEPYFLRGGHRLWVAPEIPAITYEPDNNPPVVEAAPSGVRLTQPASTHIGLEKSILLSPAGPQIEITHTIVNRGDEERDIALWGITQLPPGGLAIVPLPVDPVDPHGLQPNAEIVLWPYTGTDDSPFELLNRLVLIDTNRESAIKVGVALTRGWLAYVNSGVVFVKRATHRDGGRYLDRGASGQVYASRDFTELETLGEQVVLAPGEATTHKETWELHSVDPMTPPAQIPSLLSLDR